MLLTYLIFGLLIGSFLTVCVYRIPIGRIDYGDGEQAAASKEGVADDADIAKSINIFSPARSFCPHCKQQLSWFQNIPVVSWFMLRGKCSFCSSSISARYPTIEILTGLLSVLSFSIYGPTPAGVVIFAFSAALLVLTFIDYDHYILPNVITLPGTAIALLITSINYFTSWFVVEPRILRDIIPHAPIAAGPIEALLGIAAGAGFLFIVSELYLRVRKIEGLGMGDVKLLAMTGALFGYECALYTIFVGSLLGSAIGIALVLFTRRKMSQMLPFGPFLAVAALLYLFSGFRAVELIMFAVAKPVALLGSAVFGLLP